MQDKLPAFDTYEAKKIIKKEVGETQYKNILELSEPIAAASIAQVHFADITVDGKKINVAIKIINIFLNMFISNINFYLIS